MVLPYSNSSKDQPGKAANPARGQLNRENAENLVSRDGFGSPVPCQPACLHTQAEYGAYLRNSSRFPRRRPFIYLNRYTPSGQSEFIGSRNCVLMAFTAFDQHAHFIPIGDVGKRGAHSLVHGDLQNSSTHYRNYLEVYWPFAGGLLAVNAIGTQMRDPINSGLTRWRVAV